MMSTKEKTVVFSINDIKNYTKGKGTDNSEEYRIEDKEVFYKDSPVNEEDVKALNAYSKDYTERGIKATAVFASDAFKEDDDLEEVIYTLPYQEDNVKIVYIKDEGNYTIHTENTLKHMDHSKSLQSRMKALNKALTDGD